MPTIQTLMLAAIAYLSKPQTLGARIARVEVLNEIRRPPAGWRYLDAPRNFRIGPARGAS